MDHGQGTRVGFANRTQLLLEDILPPDAEKAPNRWSEGPLRFVKTRTT